MTDNVRLLQMVIHRLNSDGIAANSRHPTVANTPNASTLLLFKASATAAESAFESQHQHLRSDHLMELKSQLFLDNDNSTDVIATTIGLTQPTIATIVMVLITLALVCLILATIIGNVFVISAIVIERNLRTVGNYLVLSLAVTDLLVACLVMPIGAYNVNHEWRLGANLCELWTFIDVLCCTASIFHLLAIACDRFWAVTTVDYIHRRKAKHVCCGIALIWSLSALISFGPMLGWKDDDFERRIIDQKLCIVSQAMSYQIFATIFSFYAPSALLLILYYRIYQVAKTRIKLKKQRYKYRIRRRPSYYRPRKESDVKEIPSAASVGLASHRSSFNPTSDDYFSSGALAGPSGSSGFYSSSTATTDNTNATTITFASDLSPNSLSPLAALAQLDGAGNSLASSNNSNHSNNDDQLPAAINQAQSPQHQHLQTKRLSIQQFLAFQQQKQSDMCEKYVRQNQSHDHERTNHGQLGDRQTSEEFEEDSETTTGTAIIVTVPAASNILVYVDDFASTICSSCIVDDPTTLNTNEFEIVADEELEEEDEDEDDEDEEDDEGEEADEDEEGEEEEEEVDDGIDLEACNATDDTHRNLSIENVNFAELKMLDTIIVNNGDGNHSNGNGRVLLAPPPFTLTSNGGSSISNHTNSSLTSSSELSPNRTGTSSPKLSLTPDSAMLPNNPNNNPKRINHNNNNRKTSLILSPSPTTSPGISNPHATDNNGILMVVHNGDDHRKPSIIKTTTNGSRPGSKRKSCTNSNCKSKTHAKKLKFRNKITRYDNHESKQESKAAKTLTIITGIFIICWLPFFVLALVMPLCTKCTISKYFFDFCLWLGWANSTMNPFLYTIFSPDFRNAFKRLIFGHRRRQKKR